jgi:uncharacterized OsmC-like protein
MRNNAKIRTCFEQNVEAVRLRPDAGQGTATTKVRCRNGLACEVTDGKWTLRADMSEKSGGGGTAPDPGVLGRAALGTCLTIGYAMWAARRGVPLGAIDVEVQGRYDVRGEYGVSKDVEPGFVSVRYVVNVESDAPEAEVRRLIDEADAHSPWLRIYRGGVDVQREVTVRETAR